MNNKVSRSMRFGLNIVCALGVLGSAVGVMDVAHAEAPLVRTQAPAFYRTIVGKWEVTALLDENSPWPESLEVLFPDLSEEQKQALRAKTHLQPQNDFSTIAYLINTGTKLILIDAGGRGSAPTYGQFFNNMKAAGYRPEQVDDIYITHMHGDHIGGLSENGVRSFPNAIVHADYRELVQWEKLAKKGNEGAKMVVALLKPYIDAKKYQTFDGDTEFFSGFRAIASHGHTEGHSFYTLESEGRKMVFWGDFVVNDKVQFELLDAIPPGEADPAKGIALRKQLFAEAAQQAYLIGGAHFSFPGIGRVRDLGGKYIWVPVDYAAIPAATTK
ncbi:MBL fold metallo-hydrolase [Undibacterium sp. SXout11W]|uniref:MBL fold metallo-hydrolase n=1 Tax=Undibacterium sp. SXout11W TaxID=3413050 RepID=UPI003BEF9CBE